MDKVTVDCRGMQCPAPILQIAKAARQAAKSPVLLEVLADDNDFPADLKAWCRTTKAALHQLTHSGGVHRALLGLNGARPQEASFDAAASSGPTSAPATASGPMGDSSDGPPSVASRRPFSPSSANGVAAPSAAASPAPSMDVVDLRGLRAPHPVLRLSRILLESSGSRLTVHCDDPSFMSDLVTWTTATRVNVTGMRREGALVIAELALPDASNVAAAAPPAPAPTVTAPQEVARLPVPTSEPSTALATTQHAGAALVPRHDRCTILVLHNDFEALMAALLVATTSAAQGMDVVVFFSFWGVNLLRGDRPRAGEHPAKLSFLQRIMKWMMPKGPRRQKMSKMHMAGMGKGMMEYFMKKNNVMSLAELMNAAVEQRVRFVVCTMSMGIMGIQKRDVMDLPNIEFAGVTMFVEQSRTASMTLVF